jgi:hypothetical protein
VQVLRDYGKRGDLRVREDVWAAGLCRDFELSDAHVPRCRRLVVLHFAVNVMWEIWAKDVRRRPLPLDTRGFRSNRSPCASKIEYPHRQCGRGINCTA